MTSSHEYANHLYRLMTSDSWDDVADQAMGDLSRRWGPKMAREIWDEAVARIEADQDAEAYRLATSPTDRQQGGVR